MGKGAFPEDHPLFAGMAGIQTQTRWGNAAFLESDLVLAVGARFGDRHTGDLETYRARPQVHPRRHRAHPDRQGLRARPGDRRARQAHAGGAGRGTPARHHRSARPGRWAERVAELRGTLLRRDDFDDVPIKPPRVYREINEFFGPDTTFVTAIGLYQIWSGQFQQTFLPAPLPGLRAGRAAGLGGARRRSGSSAPSRSSQVVAVVGDYSFQFLMEEIAVAAQYQHPVRHRHGEQRVPGADPAGRDPLRHELRGRPALRRGRHRPRQAHGGVRLPGPAGGAARRHRRRAALGHAGVRGAPSCRCWSRSWSSARPTRPWAPRSTRSRSSKPVPDLVPIAD